MTVLERIQQAVNHVNYRRSTRRISLRDVAQTVRECLRYGYGYANGGMVANSYGYRATTAAVAAVRAPDGTVAVCTGSHSANGASPVTWFGPRSSRDVHMQEWRATKTRENLEASGSWIVLSRRDVVRIMQRERNTASHWQALHNIPAVTVTVDDSIAAGNCAMETRRVAEAMGVEQASATRILAYVAHHEPHLLTYARRAVDFVVARQQ